MNCIDLDDDHAVIVIGTGAGGATVAKVLCDSEINVIALEAGPQIEAEEFVQDEWTSYRTLSWDDERIAAEAGMSRAITLQAPFGTAGWSVDRPSIG